MLTSKKIDDLSKKMDKRSEEISIQLQNAKPEEVADILTNFMDECCESIKICD